MKHRTESRAFGAWLLAAASTLTPLASQAQIAADWTVQAAATSAAAIAVDSYYNVYAAGSTTAPAMQLSRISPAGVQLWQQAFSGATFSKSTWVTVDGADNAIQTGMVTDPDGRPLGTVVAKYSPSGALLWQDVTPSSFGYAWRAKTDSQGNVYVLSRVAKPDNTGTDEAVLSKYGAAGVREWSRSIGARFLSGQPMAVTPAGLVVVAGTGDVPGVASLAAFNAAGNSVWTSTLASNAEAGVAVGPGGEVFAIGGSSTGFLVAKYGPSWNLLWSASYAARGYAQRAVVDGAGNLVVTGAVDAARASSTVVINDWRTMKISPTGTQLWSNSYGARSTDEAPQALTLDSQGAVYVTGQGSIAVTDSLGNVVNRPSTATVKYSASGVQAWTGNLLPGSKGLGVTAGSDGGVCVIGGGQLLLGETPQTVIRYPQSGLPNQAPLAQASASPSAGVAPLLVNFSSAGSSDPDGAIASHLWDFGDGRTSTMPNPSITYSTVGTYAVRLTVRDTLGASATSAPITISANAPLPVPVSLGLGRTTIASGTTTTATVTLSNTSGAVVALRSSNAKAASVPASISVPAGSQSATFTVTAGRVVKSTAVTISATANGSTTTATLTVTK
jgi:PKD repeat protein